MDPGRVSSKFNAQDADICFKSSDNVLFLIHRENFKYSAARFPLVKHEIVPLIETSEVLELLFAFLYPNTLPDRNVRSLSIGTLTSLADAAEKYRVFSAMMTCNMRMMAIVKDHPIDVLRYAVIYHYKELLDIAAPRAVGRRLLEVVDYLPPNTIPAWIKYYQQWLDAKAMVNVYDPYGCSTCSNWVERRLVSLCTVDRIQAYYAATGRFCCAQEWRNNALRTAYNIPPFSRFLYPNSSFSQYSYE